MNAVKRFDGNTILFHIYITISYIFIRGLRHPQGRQRHRGGVVVGTVDHDAVSLDRAGSVSRTNPNNTRFINNHESTIFCYSPQIDRKKPAIFIPI